ncbi:DJ-1/PfpI family protein [Sphingomonas sp. BK345]|uniref:DJ-1/PfpI family protein n=1 Tax=Sphingomonas sp. BK345 TaxID=2586980 RepID=UPI00161B4B84|nr:DJ-1/PfpI family protein [Sphingomonas sp. BK345]MBB3475729.1 putative intracellular protease/amidase [Sphingomonas sp. BK345]
MSKGTVLLIGSNATRIEVQGNKWGATGQYLNETVVPAMALEAAGYEVVLAMPNGAKPTIDAASDAPAHFGNDEAAYRAARDYYDNSPAMNAPVTLRSVIDGGLDQYAGVFFLGGQAPAVDIMQDDETGEVLRHFHRTAKPTALLCRGPIALTAAMNDPRAFRAALMAESDDKAREWARSWPYAGYRMTIFSATEEKVVEEHILHAKMYFDMPQALTAAGGRVETTTADFEPHVVIDHELITGQNPRSDHPIAKALVEALDARQA